MKKIANILKVIGVTVILNACTPNLPGCSSEEAKQELNTQLDKWIKEIQNPPQIVGKVSDAKFIEKKFLDGFGDIYICKGTISWSSINNGGNIEFEKSEHQFHIIKNPFVKYDEFEISWTDGGAAMVNEYINKSKLSLK